MVQATFTDPYATLTTYYTQNQPYSTLSTTVKSQIIDAQALVNQLGKTTRLQPDGMVLFNNSLIDKIITAGPLAVPYLGTFLSDKIQQPVKNRLTIVEGLRTAEKMALANIPGVDKLYPAIAPLNQTTDPLIQIYLAGLYRRLKLPHTFGPLVKMLRQTEPSQAGGTVLDSTEELGGAMLELIADKVAERLTS